MISRCTVFHLGSNSSTVLRTGLKTPFNSATWGNERGAGGNNRSQGSEMGENEQWCEGEGECADGKTSVRGSDGWSSCHM